MANPNPKRKFLKGNKGGPGRPPLPPEVRELKTMTIQQLKEVISLVMSCSFEELEAMAKDEKGTVIQRMAASLAQQTIKKGNTFAFDALLNRVVGKPKEEVKVTGQGAMVKVLLPSNGSEKKVK